MKTKNILAVVVAILVISTAVFAGNGKSPATGHNAPTMDGAVWGGGADGAVWGGNSATVAQPGNSHQANGNNASDQGAVHQSLVDYLKTLAKGLGVIAEGAVWG